MIKMKKTVLFALSALTLQGCYEKYTMDYDYSAAYVAYQYDLRTFVIGEQMKFDFTVALGGVVNNDRDRAVRISIDDALLTNDLSVFAEEGSDVGNFTALDGLLGKAPFGTVCQSYVTKEVEAQKLDVLTPLPASYYQTSALESSIRKGRHTATATVSAKDEILGDEKALKPYYALGFKVSEADADVLLREKSFAIIAIKCEHRFWGNWYHGGRSVVKNDTDGTVVSEEEYPLTLPQSDSKVYTLTTVAADAVETDKTGPGNGRLKLTFDGDRIHVESADGSKQIAPIADCPSHFNGAKLLQERKLFLNYSYSNGDGTTTYVTDTLAFRNRIRDGINEWQDENPENYK